ncbi:MAG TPA: hypothetical protein VFQ43_21440 [Nitrososphaera sp.]|nr:hypothetical protein [Nitrososphaera sp.]
MPTTGNILRSVRHELYAQNVAAGMSRSEAYQLAGFKGKRKGAHVEIDKNPLVLRRIEELLRQTAAKSELSRRAILDRIFQDWELARKLGQVPAALKAAELMGREMHKMFTERKEIGGPGDFDNKSEDELRDIIKTELNDLGWEGEDLPSSLDSIN